MGWDRDYIRRPFPTTSSVTVEELQPEMNCTFYVCYRRFTTSTTNRYVLGKAAPASCITGNSSTYNYTHAHACTRIHMHTHAHTNTHTHTHTPHILLTRTISCALQEFAESLQHYLKSMKRQLYRVPYIEVKACTAGAIVYVMWLTLFRQMALVYASYYIFKNVRRSIQRRRSS